MPYGILDKTDIILYNIFDRNRRDHVMIATNYTDVRNNLKNYCDMASEDGETVIVTRKANKNVVILSLERFNLMEKEIRNSQYLAKLDRAFDQLYAGKGQEHELIEV